MFFQRGLRGKARDFNWHNTIGLWRARHLLPDAHRLVIAYPAVGNALYQPPGPAAPRDGAPRPDARSDAPPTAESFAGLDGAWAAARERLPGWTLGVVRVARPGAPVTVAITDSAFRSPYGRSQLVSISRRREVAKWSRPRGSPGRRARTAARWLHTGEILAWPGQVVAGIACLGGTFLVWTGLSLAWRRFRAWRAAPARRGERRRGVAASRATNRWGIGLSRWSARGVAEPLAAW